MKKEIKTIEKDGYNGVYWPNPNGSKYCMIAMLGDDTKDMMAKGGVKWLQKKGLNVLTMSPAPKDYGHHNYPLERFEKALAFLKTMGNEEIGIMGASTTGMLALVAASCFSEITLTIAISPSDFVMEGFYQDGKDGAHERPGDGESSVSYHGKPLPYLPYAYRHPEYWQKISEETKRRGAMVASRDLFDESEKRHPVQEVEKIKVENIKGRILLIGAEDDVLWDTCKYIRRMENRLKERDADNSVVLMTYEHGTHFIFPQTMLTGILPVGSGLFISMAFKEAKQYPKECKQTRIEVDERLSEELKQWINSAR